MTAEKLICCENAVLGYDNMIAVNNVTFDLYSGDYLCVVGENGSGKSTLLKGLLGLLPLKSGKITFSQNLKKTDIGYLPQQTNLQKDFPATVKEVVLSGCLNNKGLSPFYSKADKKRAQDNIKKLSIESIQHKSYRELSGGQQQRVLLARALCAANKLILMDEPVTGLDPVVTYDFYKLIKHLNKELGIAVIMVSHDIGCAISSASKILHLNENGTVFFGSTQDYLRSDAGKRFAQNGGSKND